MKKIVQLALLMIIVSTTANYCWEWSDMVPNSLYYWYQNRRLERQMLKQQKKEQEQQERERFDAITKKYGRSWYTSSKEIEYQKALSTLRGIRDRSAQEAARWYGTELTRDIRNKTENADEMINFLEKHEKYQWPYARMHRSYIKKITATGWGE